MSKPIMTTVAIAMTPNISGTSSRVMIRLLPKRNAWLKP